VLFGWLGRRVAEQVRARLGADRILLIDERANSFGVESGGKAQIRGNGCLALTAGELLFLMWIPRRELRIERGRITSVERASSHLGKSIFRPLLRIRFIDELGRADSVAWFVRDLQAWEAALA
jgi:hypothetical protein